MGNHALRHPVGWMGTAGLVLLLQGVPPPARGAPITWETASNTVSKADLIEGTVVLALSGGAGATVTGGGAGGASTYTFAGVSYQDITFSPAPGYRTTADISNGAPSTGDTNFDTILKSFTDANAGVASGTQTIGGLSRGASYRIQIFFNDQRPATVSRVMTYGDGEGTPHNVDIAAAGTGWGQFAIGTFTADSITQSLTHTANGFGNVHFNAILVTLAPGNMPPVLTDVTLVVSDNAPSGTVVHVLSATDTDGPDPLMYAITAGNDGGAFSLDPTSGELTVTAALDYATQSLYVLTVEASDGMAVTPATVTVHVQPSPGKAVISWGLPTMTTGKPDLIEGTVVMALSGGSVSTNVVGGGEGGVTTYAFTGVSYTNVLFFGTGEDMAERAGHRVADNAYDPSIMDTTGDGAFDAVVSSFTDSQSGITTGTLVLEGLRPGAPYKVQVFYNDQRNPSDARVMTYGDGNGNAVELAGGDPAAGVQTGAYGQHAVGTFTAEAPTQGLTMKANGFANVHFNIIVVTTARDVGMVLTIR